MPVTRDEAARAVRLAADQAVLLVGRLREAWPWLAEATVPGPQVYVERELSDGARRRLDDLVRAERGERVQLARDGLVPRPPTPAPGRVAAMDARAAVLAGVDEVAWRISSDLRRRPRMAYRQWGATEDQRLTAGLDYCAVMLRHLDRLPTVEYAVRELDRLDRVARAVCGAGPTERLLKTECPACGRRSLRADVGSPRYAEWAISCGRGDCRCRGRGCPCLRPDRTPGTRHIWPEREWSQLGRLLDRQEAST